MPLIHKQHADRLGDGGGVGGRCQPAGGGIDAENDQVVGVAVGTHEPAPVGRQGKVARVFPLARHYLDEGERAGRRVAREDRQTVGPAIGGVDETAVG